MEKADNISAICSAFSGEVIKYTTVKRGEITVYDSRLSIYGCVQPLSNLAEVMGSDNTDNQGYLYRHLLVVGHQVHRLNSIMKQLHSFLVSE